MFSSKVDLLIEKGITTQEEYSKRTLNSAIRTYIFQNTLLSFHEKNAQKRAIDATEIDKSVDITRRLMAGPVGFEPRTSDSAGRCHNPYWTGTLALFF